MWIIPTKPKGQPLKISEGSALQNILGYTLTLITMGNMHSSSRLWLCAVQPPGASSMWASVDSGVCFLYANIHQKLYTSLSKVVAWLYPAQCAYHFSHSLLFCCRHKAINCVCISLSVTQAIRLGSFPSSSLVNGFLLKHKCLSINW